MKERNDDSLLAGVAIPVDPNNFSHE
jgi:hypothetical protein